ncbi:MAG: hypothetical protein ACYDBB_16075 [Armatimonadota bacterium]
MIRQRHPVDLHMPPDVLLRWSFRLLPPLLFLLLIATILLSILTSDWREVVRRVAILHLRDALQQDVQVGQLHIDPRGRVLIRKLVVPEGAGKSRTLASVESLDIRFDPVRLAAVPTRPLSAIRLVMVDTPYLNLRRDVRGQWNYQELLKPKKRKRPSQDRFGGEVIITNGECVFQDAKGLLPDTPLAEHLTHVSARLTTAGKDYLPFRISGQSTSGHLHDFVATGGYNAATKRAQCELRYVALDLAFIRKYLPKRIPLTIEAGTIDGRLQIDAGINPQTGRFALQTTGLADVRDFRGALVLGKMKNAVTIASGQFALTSDMMELIGVQGKLNGMPIAVEGTISHFAAPALAVQVTVKNAEARKLSQLLPNFPPPGYQLAGNIDGWMQITGSSITPQISGHFAGPTLSSPFGRFDDVQGDLRYYGASMQLSNLAGRAFGGGVRGSLWLSWNKDDNTNVLFEGLADKVDAHAVMAQFVPIEKPKPGKRPSPYSLRDLYGTLSGPVSIQVERGGKATLITRSQGAVRFADLTHGNVDASLHITSEKDRTHTQIERLAANVPEGSFQLSGTIADDTTLQLALRGSEIDLKSANALITRYSAKGAVRHKENDTSMDVTGSGYVVGQITGKIDQPMLEGSFHAKDGTLTGRDFTDLTGKVVAVLDTSSHFAFKNVHLVSKESQLAFSELNASYAGDTVEQPWGVSGKMIMPRTTLASLGKAIGLDIPLEGFVDGELEFSDFPTNAHGKGKVVLRRPAMRVSSSLLEFDNTTIEFTIEDNAIQIANGVMVYQGMPISVTGSIPFAPNPTDGELSLHVTAPDLDLDKLTALVPGEDPNAGKLTTDCRLQLPVDIEGSIGINATITAQVFPKNGSKATIADTIADTLAIDGTFGADEPLKIAGIPYQGLSAILNYQGKSQQIILAKFTMQRAQPEETEKGVQHSLTAVTPALLLMPGSNTQGYGLQLLNKLEMLHAPFTIALTRPSTLTLPTNELDLHLALQNLRLDTLRQDLLTMNANTASNTFPNTEERSTGNEQNISFLTPLAEAMAKIPYPFYGNADNIRVDVSGSILKPVIDTDFTVKNLFVGNTFMRNLTGTLSYDTITRMVKIDSLNARGGPDSEAYIHADGSITLPVKDKDGKELVAGPIALSIDAQNISLAYLRNWGGNSLLKDIGGKVSQVNASIEGTTAKPKMNAAITVDNPALHKMEFASLFAHVILEQDPQHPETQRIVIGQEVGDNILPSVLSFKNPKNEKMEPLEIYGYLPVRWTGPLSPEIPGDQPIFIDVRLPKQGLDLVRSYATNFPAGEGTVEGSLQIGGTRLQPKIENGVFYAQSPELVFTSTDQDLPNQLKQVVVDIGFRSDPANRQGNIISINDISALVSRSTAASAKKRGVSLPGWLRSLFFGKEKKELPTTPGAVVVKGTIRVPQEIFAGEKLPSYEEITNQLGYDLYAKTVRAPLPWRDTFQGIVSAYLHLGSKQEPFPHPQLTGVVYAEDATFTYTAKEEEPGGALFFPLNPELALALQSGPNNEFVIAPDNKLMQLSFTASLPIMPTMVSSPSPKKPATIYFSPIAMADKQYTGAKPPVNPEHLAYRYTDKTFQEFDSATSPLEGAQDTIFAGTRGWVTGTLAQPEININYALQPRKGEIDLPGGILTVERATGQFYMALNDPDKPMVLRAEAVATGQLDQTEISAVIHDDVDLMQSMDATARPDTNTPFSAPTSPIHFTVVNGTMMTDKEISERLTGFPDILAALQNKDQSLAPITTLSTNIVLRGPLRELAKHLGLGSASLYKRSDSLTEASITTQDLAKSNWGSFRLGGATTFDTPASWRLWFDYRVPEYRLFKNLAIHTEINNQNGQSGRNINLQYQFEF